MIYENNMNVVVSMCAVILVTWLMLVTYMNINPPCILLKDTVHMLSVVGTRTDAVMSMLAVMP